MVSTGLCVIGLVLLLGPVHGAFNSLGIINPSETSPERGTAVERWGYPHVELGPLQRRKDLELAGTGLELANALPSGSPSLGGAGGGWSRSRNSPAVRTPSRRRGCGTAARPANLAGKEPRRLQMPRQPSPEAPCTQACTAAITYCLPAGCFPALLSPSAGTTLPCGPARPGEASETSGRPGGTLTFGQPPGDLQ